MQTVKIKGMSCQHCVKAVKKALEEIEGVENVNVDLLGGQATYDVSRPVDLDKVKEKINKAGYEVV